MIMKTIEQQITFRHKLAYYLEMSYLQYENLRHLYFLDWCKKVAEQKYIPLEALSKNDYLKNWFDDQWLALVENGVKRTYENDIDKGIFNADDIALMLDIFYSEIYFYPKVLLEKIRKELKIKSI